MVTGCLIIENTIRSYRKTIEELLDYAKEQNHVPLFELKMEHLAADCILSYLAYFAFSQSKFYHIPLFSPTSTSKRSICDIPFSLISESKLSHAFCVNGVDEKKLAIYRTFVLAYNVHDSNQGFHYAEKWREENDQSYIIQK